MASTEAQKRASQNYLKRSVVQIGLHLNKKTDADIIEYLERQPSKMAAIKRAVREMMASEKNPA